MNKIQINKDREIDMHVGKRIRERRKELGLTQSMVAERLNLTFQQVQKYERGINRVSASRLYDIKEILNVNINYFFEELSDLSVIENPVTWTTEIWELINSYYQLPEKLRQCLRLTLKHFNASGGG